MAASPTPKLVVVVGATGNQGGSVARRFLRAGPDRFHVRGLTRDTNSPPSQALITLGADMVQADLYDCDSLKAAFRGASVIFSVTNYWEPFAPHNLESSKLEAVKLGFGTVRSYAGYMEATAGRNIADAAASTVDTLDGNGLIVSTLSHARRCSGGKFQELYHFDAKADVFPFYVRERHPNLAAKMRCVHTGYFMTSHRILPQLWLVKLDNGSFEMRFCTDPNKPVPHLDPVADMGTFVYAVYQHKAESVRDYMAEGTSCTWPQWVATWSKVTGVPATYRQISREDMIQACGGDHDFGGEIADMFDYSSDPGYDGGMHLLRAGDLQQAGIECPMTSLEDWLGGQDWSAVLTKEVESL